jgi:hypothetical protein
VLPQARAKDDSAHAISPPNELRDMSFSFVVEDPLARIPGIL